MYIADVSIIERYSRIYCERKLNELNIGLTELHVLTYLANSDTVNQDTIAKRFMIDKGTVAKALSKLEEKKLIKRTDNPAKKREKLVELTEKGTSSIEILNNTLNDWFDCIYEGLTDEEMKTVQEITEKISINAVKAVNEKIKEVI